MKIGLIYLNYNGGACPPIGLMSVATHIKKKIPFCCPEIIDVNFDNVADKIKKSKYDLLGMSAMTIDYNKAVKLAQRIKFTTKVPIIIGGVHISLLPQSLKRCFNLGVIGKGEETMLEIVQLYKQNASFDHRYLKDIPGLVYFHNNKIIKTDERKLIEPLDTIPIPDSSLINPKYFAFKPLLPWGEFGREGIILTSRGCPYKCVFCSTTQFWKKVRFFSVEHIVAEVKNLVDRFNVDHIQIFDDLFTINKNRLKLIASEFEKKRITKRVKFSGQLRANLVDDELCEILKRMNFQIASFGFESGSERILRYLKNETVTVEHNKKAIETCVRYGFKVVGSLIFGSPGETIEDMHQTIEFIKFTKKAGADRIWSFVMTPFPATKIWDIAKERRKVSEDMDFDLLSHYAVDNPLLLDETIDKKEFKKIFYQASSHLNYYKWKKLRSLLRNDPIRTFKLILKNPFDYLKRISAKYI